MTNVIFVEPRGSRENVFAKWMTLPLLGPIQLATILKKRGHDVKVYNENLLRRDILKHELRADVLCLTGLTSTIERAYEIAGEFRALNPESKVIIGGIHASFNKEEAARFGDHVVVGEGEEIIIDLIEKDSNEKFVYANKKIELDEFPVPDFRVLKNHERMVITPVMTSRGCPFNCNFCAVTAMFGKKYRIGKVDRTIQELRRIRTKTAFFYDDNLCADRERSHLLFDSMKKENFKFKWTAQVRCDATRDEKLIKKMAEANCQIVCIGFESINSKTLNNYNKGQSLQDIKMAIKRFHDYGIKIHGMFIFGSDEDDKSVFRSTTDFCNRRSIDSVQYMTLVPLPGTPIFNNFQTEKRLLHKKWRFYDGMHVVFKPKNFTPSELQYGAIDCYRDFYTYTKALNGAMNIVYDRAINCIRSSGNKLRRYFPVNWDTTLLAKLIMKKWLIENKHYLRYLNRV